MQKSMIYNDNINLYNNIFNNTQEAIVVVNKDNRIIQVNKSCEDITVYSFDEIKNDTPYVFFWKFGCKSIQKNLEVNS